MVKKFFGPQVPYLIAIGALMYLANCTWPDIAFSINLLARYSSTPTQRHWNGISMYYATSMERLTWDCFIQKDQVHN